MNKNQAKKIKQQGCKNGEGRRLRYRFMVKDRVRVRVGIPRSLNENKWKLQQQSVSE